MNKLDDLYHEEDFKRPMWPYALYRRSLESILDFNQVENFADFGCINGRLMESLKQKYPQIKVKGYDIFSWAKDYADVSVKDAIEIKDLRNSFESAEKYDLVNCTEVGEHIDRECEQVFIDNLVNATKRWLVLSWSDEINPQHFNPRSAAYIKKQLKKRGFRFLKRQTKILRNSLKQNINELGFQWWSESVCVYERQQNQNRAEFSILSTSNQDAGSLSSYIRPLMIGSSLQEQFVNLTKVIKQKVSGSEPFSLARFGDGDFFFLMRLAKGSARPGRRGSMLGYDQIDSSKYRYNFFKNDEIAFELQINYRMKYLLYCLMHPPLFQKQFLKAFLKRLPGWKLVLANWIKMIFQIFVGPKYSFEPVYSLVATRWIFRQFPDGIGLIGNENKIELVKNLLKHQDYKNYLGINNFAEFVSIPQKGAADYPEELLAKIGEQIKNSKAKVFLVGLGHSKTFLVSQLRQYTDAVIIDVGTGIDAIAGCINHERPYFADWTNYRITGFDYKQVDQMDYGIYSKDQSQYKTIYLN